MTNKTKVGIGILALILVVTGFYLRTSKGGLQGNIGDASLPKNRLTVKDISNDTLKGKIAIGADDGCKEEVLFYNDLSGIFAPGQVESKYKNFSDFYTAISNELKSNDGKLLCPLKISLDTHIQTKKNIKAYDSYMGNADNFICYENEVTVNHSDKAFYLVDCKKSAKNAVSYLVRLEIENVKGGVVNFESYSVTNTDKDASKMSSNDYHSVTVTRVKKGISY